MILFLRFLVCLLLALLLALEAAPAGTSLGQLPLAMDAAERLTRARRLLRERVLLPLAV